MVDLPDDTAADSVVADRAYDSDAIRHDLAMAGFEVVIPPRKDRVDPPPYDEGAYQEREEVERLVSRVKRMRRVATRSDKLGAVFLAMVHIACIASILLGIIDPARIRQQSLGRWTAPDRRGGR
jgi:transposase